MVRFLIARIQTPVLKREARRRIEIDKAIENEKNVEVFINNLVGDANNCMTYGPETTDEEPEKFSPPT